ncbi:MAG: hypothetical protein CL833_05315 [Crocinitomicaceae bacterium]|nr:hypothetical protein [Crocinitomicaceae bacterium]
MLNNCQFLGKLTHPPETETENGVVVLRFELEIEEFRRDKSGEKKRSLVFLEFEAWDTAALAIEKYAEEDSLMLVESSARNFQNAEIVETYFRVNSFKILH